MVCLRWIKNIDPANYKNGKFCLKAIAYDMAGLTSTDKRNVIWKDGSFVTSSSDVSSAPSDSTSSDSDNSFDFRMPFDTAHLSFSIENSISSEELIDPSLSNVEEGIQLKGYTKVSSSIATVSVGTPSELIPFTIKSGTDYQLMLDSADGSFDVEIYKPNGTLYSTVSNPSTSYSPLL